MKASLKSVASGATLALFALFALGSGKKAGDASAEGGAAATSGGARSVKASCNQITLTGSCTEYPKGSSFALAQGVCQMLDAGNEGWGKNPCPDDKVVGKCVNSTKDAFYEDETEYYYAPQYTTESAQKECTTDSLVKGKTFTAGTWKPKADEARGSCIRRFPNSKHTTPDECEEVPYSASPEEFAVLKMNCSTPDLNQFFVGKACPQAMKDGAASKCEEKNGSVHYSQPPDAKNAKDFCESANSGKYTKLGGAAAPAAKATAAPKASAKPKK